MRVPDFLTLFDDNQIMRIVIQHLVPVRCDENQILNPDAGSPGLVDSRFNGVYNAGLLRTVIGERDITGLVVLQSDKMSESVGKIRAVSALRDDVAGTAVYRSNLNAGAEHLLGSFVGFPDQIVNGSGFLVRCLPVIKGSCHIGAIIVDDAADIEQNRISLLKHRVIRHVVRICGMITEGDNRIEGMGGGTQ